MLLSYAVENSDLAKLNEHKDFLRFYELQAVITFNVAKNEKK